MILEGIQHINDLKIDKFLDLVRRLNNKDKSLELSVKFDGSANLGFGLDDKGKLYFSRDVKGQPDHKHSTKDWPGKPMYNPIRSAVAALLSVKDVLEKQLKPGDYVGCEVLFETIPNAIEYGDNYIIVHDAAFNSLIKKLRPTKAKIDLYYYNPESKKIDKSIETVTYSFSGKEVVRSNKYKLSIGNDINQLEDLMKQKNKTFKDSSNYDVLTFRAVGKDKDKIKREKESLTKQISNLQLDIKDKLIDSILNKLSAGAMAQPPVFDDKGNNVGGSWPEGVVIKDLKTGELSKIVSVFPIINKFLWYYREMAMSGAGPAGSFVPGVMRTFQHSVAEKVFGIKGLKSVGIVKIINNKYKSATANEKILRYLKDNGFKFTKANSARNSFVNEIKKAIKSLNKLKREFDKTGKEKVLKVKRGSFKRDVKHDPVHIRKTYETFLDIETELNDYLKLVQRVSENTPEGTAVQLLRIFFGQRNLNKLNEDYNLQKFVIEKLNEIGVLHEGGTNVKIGVLVGRFQPPQRLHIELIRKALMKNNKVYVFVAGQKLDKNRNPFPHQIRANVLAKFVKSNKVMIHSAKSGFIPGLIDEFVDLNNVGEVNVYAGTDRIGGYKGMFKNYWDHDNVKVKVNELKRDPDSVSATKVRESIKNNDFKSFVDYMPEGLSLTYLTGLFKKYRKYLT